MKIFATVDFGRLQITQGWEMINGDDGVYLKVMTLENGGALIVGLEERFIKNIGGDPTADKAYLATIALSEAMISDSINSN